MPKEVAKSEKRSNVAKWVDTFLGLLIAIILACCFRFGGIMFGGIATGAFIVHLAIVSAPDKTNEDSGGGR